MITFWCFILRQFPNSEQKDSLLPSKGFRVLSLILELIFVLSAKYESTYGYPVLPVHFIF
jgi:hypothetical protein